MKKYFFITLIFFFIIFYSIYEFRFADKITVNRLIKDGVTYFESEDLPEIENLLSIDCENRDQLLKEGDKFFKEYNPLKIKIVKKVLEIDNNAARMALFILITSRLKGLGKVTGRETVGLEFKKEKVKKYRGWRIVNVELDYQAF